MGTGLVGVSHLIRRLPANSPPSSNRGARPLPPLLSWPWLWVGARLQRAGDRKAGCLENTTETLQGSAASWNPGGCRRPLKECCCLCSILSVTCLERKTIFPFGHSHLLCLLVLFGVQLLLCYVFFCDKSFTGREQLSFLIITVFPCPSP